MRGSASTLLFMVLASRSLAKVVNLLMSTLRAYSDGVCGSANPAVAD